MHIKKLGFEFVEENNCFYVPVISVGTNVKVLINSGTDLRKMYAYLKHWLLEVYSHMFEFIFLPPVCGFQIVFCKDNLWVLFYFKGFPKSSMHSWAGDDITIKRK